jgi:hypothetical protein
MTPVWRSVTGRVLPAKQLSQSFSHWHSAGIAGGIVHVQQSVGSVPRITTPKKNVKTSKRKQQEQKIKHVTFCEHTRNSPRGVHTESFTLPQKGYHLLAVFLDSGPTLTSKARTTTHDQIKTNYIACANAAGHHLSA